VAVARELDCLNTDMIKHGQIIKHAVLPSNLKQWSNKIGQGMQNLNFTVIIGWIYDAYFQTGTAFLRCLRYILWLLASPAIARGRITTFFYTWVTRIRNSPTYHFHGETGINGPVLRPEFWRSRPEGLRICFMDLQPYRRRPLTVLYALKCDLVTIILENHSTNRLGGRDSSNSAGDGYDVFETDSLPPGRRE
jgi:hypothetical protein